MPAQSRWELAIGGFQLQDQKRMCPCPQAGPASHHCYNYEDS